MSPFAPWVLIDLVKDANDECSQSAASPPRSGGRQGAVGSARIARTTARITSGISTTASGLRRGDHHDPSAPHPIQTGAKVLQCFFVQAKLHFFSFALYRASPFAPLQEVSRMVLRAGRKARAQSSALKNPVHPCKAPRTRNHEDWPWFS